MHRAILIAVGIVFLLASASMPMCCQYVQREGPAWARPLEKYGDLVPRSNEGMDVSFGLLAFFLGAAGIGAICKWIEE